MSDHASANGTTHAAPFALHEDAWGRLVLTDGAGRQYADVQPIRAFPISEPGRYVALCDLSGREVAWVDDLASLPEPLARILAEALARREFVPHVRRVLHVSAAVEPSEWEVETDRGRTRFILNSEDDIRPLSEHRALVVDAHGLRYLIADVRQLDAHSRALLERYL